MIGWLGDWGSGKLASGAPRTSFQICQAQGAEMGWDKRVSPCLRVGARQRSDSPFGCWVREGELMIAHAE